MAIVIRSVQRKVAVLSYRYAATASRSYKGCSCTKKEQHSILQVPDCQSLAPEIFMPKGSYTAIPSDLIAALEPGHSTDAEIVRFITMVWNVMTGLNQQLNQQMHFIS
jgi:hypothetical protein